MFKGTLKKAVLAYCLMQAGSALAVAPQSEEWVEAKVDAYLKQMNMGDLIDYTRSENGFMIPPQKRLGIPGIVAFDSAMGVHTGDPLPGTQYPSPSALSASWSINRAHEYGLAIGYETRAMGGQELIAPGLALYRMPYGGRAGEYLSGEDPFIGSVLGAAVTNALQTQGVHAIAKHLVGNDQEADRHNLNVNIDERTLRELYLPGFESAAKNGNAASMMCSFNRINGDFGCESHHLITSILKGEWGYQGFVMTDYNGMQDPYKAAMAGTDIEMPDGLFFTRENLLPYTYTNQLPYIVMEDKARRNLRSMVAYGFDEGLPEVNGIKDLSHGAAAALNMAREGIVLLENREKAQPGKKHGLKAQHANKWQHGYKAKHGGASQGNTLLPLDRKAKIAVVGTMANSVPGSPFGSHYTVPTQYVDELSGLRELASNARNVDFLEALSLNPETARWYQPIEDGGKAKHGNKVQHGNNKAKHGHKAQPGLKAEYFDNVDLSGAPVVTRVEPGLNWNWMTSTNTTTGGVTTMDAVAPQPGHFSARFTGSIQPTVSGDQVFKVHADGPYRLWVNDELILESDGEPVAKDLVYSPPQSGKAVNLKAGQEYSVRLEYRRLRGNFVTWNGGFTGVRMSWAALDAPKGLDKYDAVIVAAGRNGEYEGEAFDHPFELPELQSDLISNLSQANPNTIVVLHGGAAHKMTPWVDDAGAVLEVWYPGQQGGQALAEVLFGQVNPSGKLPISIERNIEDNPAYKSYPDIMAYRGDHPKGWMTYSEGMYLGYRGYDRSGVDPLYPFGYGLSYTEFDYSNLELSSNVMAPGATVQARFTVTNTGSMAGFEVAQLYVAPQGARIDRPVKELKGFDKVYLKPGESKVVSIPLDERSLAYFDTRTNNWNADAGQYIIQVGASSAELPLKARLQTLYDDQLTTRDSNPLPKPVQQAVQVAPSKAY